jgi:hypothetical protein
MPRFTQIQAFPCSVRLTHICNDRLVCNPVGSLYGRARKQDDRGAREAQTAVRRHQLPHPNGSRLPGYIHASDCFLKALSWAFASATNGCQQELASNRDRLLYKSAVELANDAAIGTDEGVLAAIKGTWEPNKTYGHVNKDVEGDQ